MSPLYSYPFVSFSNTKVTKCETKATFTDSKPIATLKSPAVILR